MAILVDHRHEGGAAVAGLRPRAALPPAGRARRDHGRVVVPQGRQRRVHADPRAGGGVVRRRDPPRGPGRRASSRRTAGSPASRSRTAGVPRADRRVRAGPAPDVHGAGRPARAAGRPGRRDPPLPVPGHVGQGQLRARRAARVPGPRRPRATSSAASPTSGRRSTTSSVPTTRRSTAGTAPGPYLDCAIQSTIDPDMAPPGKHVMSCFVQWVPYELRESNWDEQRQNLGDTVQATLESFFPGFGNLVLQREVVTPQRHRAGRGPHRGQHLPRRAAGAPDVHVPARAGLSDYRTPIERLLPVRLRDASRRLRQRRPGQARVEGDPQGPRPKAEAPGGKARR